MKEKTREEIEALKKDWLKDPCWDIEATEGFEAHHDELYIYRLEQEVKSLEKRKSSLICPLLSLAQGEFVPASCQGDRCAWFVYGTACALKLLVQNTIPNGI